MKIVERREVCGLAALYLAEFGGDCERQAEFVDTLEPGVPKTRKWVMMISTQIGCAVGCRMCDAGAIGFRGNLSAEEMLAQIRHVLERNPELDASRHPKIKIHFARMGEPALNPEVLGALRALARELPYPGVIPSLSTVAPKSPAVEPFFEELLEVKDEHYSGGRFQLQFSLHATDEGKRREIVPIRKWGLEEIARYGARFVRPGDRKVTLNFAPAPGEAPEAARLIEVFDPERFLVKITPVNPTRRADATGSTFPWERAPGPIAGLAGELRRGGFQVILSPSLPEEIEAETSCGQLWSKALKEGASLERRRRELESACYISRDNLEAKSRSWLRELGRGRRLDLEGGKAGLLVVDLQDFFLSRRSPAYLPQSRAILPNAVRLASAFRGAGRPVFFVRHAHEDPERDGGLMASWWGKVCLDGSALSRVSDLLEPRPEEVFRKCRYSAFSNPALEEALRAAGVSQLVVAGIVTNLCVESTVRDAFDRDFATFVAADATAAHSEEIHLSSLKTLAQGFSGVRLTRDVLEALQAGGH